MNDFKHDYTDKIVCPFCGDDHFKPEDVNFSDAVVDCGSCERPFAIRVNRTITYTTTKLPEAINQRLQKGTEQ